MIGTLLIFFLPMVCGLSEYSHAENLRTKSVLKNPHCRILVGSLSLNDEFLGFCRHSSIKVFKYSNFQDAALNIPVLECTSTKLFKYYRIEVFNISSTQLLICSTLGWASRILQQHQRCPWRAFRRRPVFHLPVLARLGKARHIANSYVPFSQVIQIFLCGDSIVD